HDERGAAADRADRLDLRDVDARLLELLEVRLLLGELLLHEGARGVVVLGERDREVGMALDAEDDLVVARAEHFARRLEASVERFLGVERPSERDEDEGSDRETKGHERARECEARASLKSFSERASRLTRRAFGG